MDFSKIIEHMVNTKMSTAFLMPAKITKKIANLGKQLHRRWQSFHRNNHQQVKTDRINSGEVWNIILNSQHQSHSLVKRRRAEIFERVLCHFLSPALHPPFLGKVVVMRIIFLISSIACWCQGANMDLDFKIQYLYILTCLVIS